MLDYNIVGNHMSGFILFQYGWMTQIKQINFLKMLGIAFMEMYKLQSNLVIDFEVFGDKDFISKYRKLKFIRK